MKFLLDANVLIALTDVDHVAHARVTPWFKKNAGEFATCPITQGALIRYWVRVRPHTTMRDAKEFLKATVSMPGHEFWPDSLSYLDLPTRGITGYRMVTDAYLAALARKHKGRLATLDRALADLHGPDAILIS